MRHLNLRFGGSFAAMATAVLCLSSGCEQVDSVVDNVKGTVSGESKESTASTPTDTGTANPVSNDPPKQSTPKQPTPEELIADFKKLAPNAITDGAIKRVGSQPESAAAITEIEIQGKNGVTEAGLVALAGLPNLTSIKISGNAMKPDGLKNLGKVTSLQQVSIATSTANDSVISSLADIPNLQSLDLSSTKITPGAAVGFGGMKKLEVLNLQRTETDDSVVAVLSTLPLKELNLSRTRITNASLPLLAKMPTLESLILSFTQVTGAGFKGFSRSGLKKLSVGETNFGIDGFVNIKGMKALEDLNVFRAQLLQHKKCNVFRTFPKLRVLNAGGNAITNEGLVVFFKGHRTLEDLNLSGNKGINDAGLEALIGVKTLKLLNVSNTGVRSQGPQALFQKLPNCTIYSNEVTIGPQ